MTTQTKVAEIIAQVLRLETEEVPLDCELLEDLGANGLDMSEIIITLEAQYDISITDAEAENLSTVQDIVDLIETKI